MPNRILRDGILTSEAVSSLSWAAEVFYRRLMSVVDDHGRFHALPKLVRSACYPLHIDTVSDTDIGQWLAECMTASLVGVYEAADGKRYLRIEKFGQQVRSKSKFPEPVASTSELPLEVASNCYQPQAFDHLDGDGDGGVVVCEDEDGNSSADAEVVIGDAGSPSKDRIPNCPHQQLIDLYAKHLPELPYPRIWEGERQNAMRARWRWVLTAKQKNGQQYATDEASAVAWFDRFFAYVAKSDFLSGRNGKWSGCDLGWLVKAENFAKVVQGNYENKGSK